MSEHERKREHLHMALSSQVLAHELIEHFYYEPFLQGLPSAGEFPASTEFLNKKMRVPLWVSSMTGGAQELGEINKNLAKVAREFGLGMGVGSCRALLTDSQHFSDFNMRPILGDSIPFYANIGIAQVEALLLNKDINKLHRLVERLSADGLIIHVNPLQEWFQKEGDLIKNPPLETIEHFLQKTRYPVIVKEVGQGIGPQSLYGLLKLPLAAVDFGAFGGTNFSQLEFARASKNAQNGPFEQEQTLSRVGHTAEEMIILVSSQLSKLGDQALCREFIVSGGIGSFLYGFYLLEKLKGVKGVKNCVYGQGQAFLQHAHDLDKLREFVAREMAGFVMAERFLTLK